MLSLVDDVMIEQMRRFHCQREGEPYTEIAAREEDARARRITAYLDLLDRLVGRQVAALRASPFEPGSEITRYYELLPDGPLAQEYREMLAAGDRRRTPRAPERLRAQAAPGGIDVNIMAKGDRDIYRDGEKLAPQFSDASAALRGFAQSGAQFVDCVLGRHESPLVHLRGPISRFFSGRAWRLKKKIVLK